MSMHPSRSFVRALIPALLIVVLMAGAAFAQEGEPSPGASPAGPQPGICAPWHRCVAYGGMALSGLLVIALGLGYMIQRRGFETLEHRQGQPSGVPVSKE